ncbi:MAG: phosphatidylglycerophosphatase A [Opitutales bacterium]|nr:phosphatidylglycerophosphatase A [Opitutales bacterium]
MNWLRLRRSFLWVRVLPTHVVVGASTLGPLGERMRAPGTWGSLAGLALFAVLFYGQHPITAILLNLVLIYIAMAFTDEAEERLRLKDPGKIILDEFVAMPLCFIGLTPVMMEKSGWVVMLPGFALFRLLDITKPWIVGRMQSLPGGIGCVADDVVAALLTNVILQIVFGFI